MRSDDPVIHQEYERLVRGLQEKFNRRDWGQLVKADLAAAPLIRKYNMVNYEAPHTKIAAFNAKKLVEEVDENIRKSVCSGAALPPDEAIDRFIKLENLNDRQIGKYIMLANGSIKPPEPGWCSK